ncbi:MAG TPA: hypothetical protein VEO91_09620 [Candidatus Limnocylindria bacterium]|nr:hypothetical protein [Candidatus Limnocylindria bacterium]
MTSRADPRRSARQVAAIVALLAAAVATLATSPLPPPTSRLVERASGRVHLDSEHPSASGIITIRFSPEALIASSGGIYRDGRISIHVGAVGSAGVPGAASVLLTATPQGSTPALTVNGTDAGAGIDDLCTAARACELTYLVAFELEDILPAAGIDVPWSAEAEITYSGRDIVPEGASITVKEVDPIAAAAAPPGLEASLGEEEVTLSADHPMVVRHVELELSDAGVPEPRDSPITGVMELTSTWLDRPATDRFGPTPFDVLVIPDESPANVAAGGGTLPRSIGNRYDPFTTCTANRSCRRGVAIVFEWLDHDPAAVHRVSWSSIVRVRYPGLDALPKGATLSARVDDRRSAGPPAASLNADLQETLRVVTDRSGRADASGQLVFVANADALPVDDLGPLPPPSIALITVVVARGDGMPVADPAVHISLSGQAALPTNPNGGSQIYLKSAKPFPAFPLRICEVGQPCQVDVALGVWVQDQAAPIPPGTPLDIVVTVHATLPYVGLIAPPKDGELTVHVEWR